MARLPAFYRQDTPPCEEVRAVPEIIHAVDETAIAATIEANINDYLLSFARLPGAFLHADSESVWIDSGVPDATFNSIVHARFSRPDIDARIDAVLSHFRHRAQPVTWHIGPTSEPPDLAQVLLAHGMTHSEDEPGMAIEIERMRDDVGAPPGLAIEPVCDERGLRAWVDVWLFPVPDDVRQSIHTVLQQRGLGADLSWRYYIGRLDGKPVAISELFVGHGVAAVHYVVTLPEVRRRGIGTAMTLHVLREARARGYGVAVLTASPEGISVYRRIGFREYCWFRRYEWHPDHGTYAP
jgi:GNAT superfamily N-acetyltransferase